MHTTQLPNGLAAATRPTPTGTVRTVLRVKAVDTQTLRNERWGEVMQQAGDGVEAFAITKRGQVDAVLMSYAMWRRGNANPDVAEADRVVGAQLVDEVSVRELRAHLRRHRDAVRTGRHVLVRPYGAEITVVLAPYAWTRATLPELGDVDDAGTQQRYRGDRPS